MNRLTCLLGLALTLHFAAAAQAGPITLTYSGTISRVYDANDVGQPAIDFTPIPVGSSFTGTITYNPDAPLTNGGTGFARYIDVTPSSSSLTVNGLTFPAGTGPGDTAFIVTSQEGGFGFSGVSISNQPISLPAGWGVAIPQAPYFTTQFFNIPAQSHSLTMPTELADFPLANARLVLDFQQSVTVGGQTYGGRLFIEGTISTLTVENSPAAVPEPSTLSLGLVSLAVLGAWRARRRAAAARA